MKFSLNISPHLSQYPHKQMVLPCRNFHLSYDTKFVAIRRLYQVFPLKFQIQSKWSPNWPCWTPSRIRSKWRPFWTPSWILSFSQQNFVGKPVEHGLRCLMLEHKHGLVCTDSKTEKKVSELGDTAFCTYTSTVHKSMAMGSVVV